MSTISITGLNFQALSRVRVRWVAQNRSSRRPAQAFLGAG
jgi:phage protein U